MNKKELISRLKEFREEIKKLKDDCQETKGIQIQTKKVISRIESLSTEWFEEIEPNLNSKYEFGDSLHKYRDLFSNLLRSSSGRPSTSKVITILDQILKTYNDEILVRVFETTSNPYKEYPIYDEILSHTAGYENDYLQEAVECAIIKKRRAAMVLGWCAAISRLQLYVSKLGFEKFNNASVEMFKITSGRYKRFNKKFNIINLSDLRMSVFDSDLLWILEYLGAIDGNQRDKLENCFTMRNNSAHPGDAIITDENMLSFFSDIDSIIFNNPKFNV